MTQEEKAKAYDEALKKLHEIITMDNHPVLPKEIGEFLFPELTESEDVRIKKDIIQFFRDASNGKTRVINSNTFAEWADYLEKQKDILQERAQNITSNMLEDRIEGIQRELIEFLSNTINASWVDIIKSADSYAERIKNIIEEQKEPENVSATTMIPSCWTEKQKKQEPIEPELKTPDWVHGGWDNEYMINTVIGRYSLHAEVAKKRGDTHDYNLSKSMENWLRNVAKPLILDKPKEQKPAEWSEDERIRKFLIWIVNNIIGNSKGLTLSKEKTRELIRNYDGIKTSDVLAYLEMQKEQKPVKFNDDTEVGLDRALQIIKKAKGNLCGYQSDDGIYECDHAIQTLEHILKNGIEQKPVEWSEEDEDTYERVYCLFRDALDKWYECVFAGCYPKITKKKVLAMLKSLYLQPHWKSSEEQMR